MLRPDAESGKAPLLEKPGDRPFRQIHGKACLDEILEIAAAPAHQLVALDLGPFLHHLIEVLKLRPIETRPTARLLPVAQSGKAFGIVADHPIAQRLALSPCSACRLLARSALQNQGNRQNPSRLIGIIRKPRPAPQFRNRQIHPPNRNRHSHSPKRINHFRESSIQCRQQNHE